MEEVEVKSVELINSTWVAEAGFKTTVLPMASAGAIFQTRSMRGKFQGTIAPTTPIEDQPAIFSSIRLAHPA